jgi:type IV pilus assembly protein PilY1
MLHAFSATGSAAAEAAVTAFAADPLNIDKENAAKAAVALDVTLGQDGGQELWAYIPSMVLPNLYKLADKDYANKHRYFVDSTPVVSDICSQDCDSSFAVWKTILVGGLGLGGRGYYALDITDPVNPKALWEFSNADDANVGYTYGSPRITKLVDGTWVVLLTSGYNNVPNADGAGGDGKGHLYVLKAATGERVITPSITATTTDGGDAGTPSGLAQIALNVINPSSDNTAQAAYAGDLKGNLWRFDINDNIGASGADAQLLASLKDGAGKAQPITTKPEVGVIEGFPVLFVGTGKILGESDATDTSVQSIYAIKDPIFAAAGNPEVAIYSNPGGARDKDISDLSFVRQVLDFEDCPANSQLLGLCSKDEKVLTATNNAVDFTPTKNNGWYVDLISSGERANTNPALALGVLAVNTNIPSSVACSVGGESYAYFFNYLTGGPIYSPGNGDSTLNNGVLGVKIADALSSSPTLVMTDSGKLISITVTSDNVFHSNEPPLPPGASVTRRTSWRELIRE